MIGRYKHPRGHKRKRYTVPNSFAQKTFQYVMNTKFNVDPTNPDQRVVWDYVEAVIFQAEDEEYSCPICFDTPCAPKVAPCGHILCFPCFIHIFNGYDVSDSGHLLCKEFSNKCPLCNEIFSIESLRPVKMNYMPPKIIGDECEFILLKKRKRSTVINLGSDDKKDNSVPYHLDENAKFCRYQLLDIPNPNIGNFGLEADLLQQDKKELLSGLVEIEGDEKMYYEIALDYTLFHLRSAQGCMEDSWQSAYQDFSLSDTHETVDTNHEIESEKSQEEVPDSWEDIEHGTEEITVKPIPAVRQNNDYDEKQPTRSFTFKDDYLFYQENTGAKLFLHPDCINTIRKHYGSWFNLPQAITGKIVKLESLSISRALRNKYPLLAHLPLGTDCQLCTIDFNTQ